MQAVNVENNQELLVEFQQGSEQAFDHLFTHFYPTLCVYANRILNELSHSQDMAQEGLVKAWHRRTEFETYYKLKSFLYTVVRNSCFNELEKNKVKKKYESSIGTSEADESDALKNIIQAEVVSRIFAQVDALPEQCRKIIRMTFEEGKKPKEIASELGITVSTVNSQKMRGLTLLRGKLSDKDYLVAIALFVPGLWH